MASLPWRLFPTSQSMPGSLLAYTAEVLLSPSVHDTGEMLSVSQCTHDISQNNDYLTPEYQHDQVAKWKHLPELCTFIEGSQSYVNILDMIVRVMGHFSAIGDRTSAKYVSSSGLKILEDAYRQCVFQQLLTTTWDGSQSEKNDFNGSNVEDVIMWMHRRVESLPCTRDRGDNHISIYSILISYLLSRYLDDVPVDRNGETLFSVIDEIATILYMRERSPQIFSSLSFENVDIPRVSDSFCTCAPMDTVPEWPQVYMDGRIFERALSAMQHADILVLREAGYLYRCNVSLHVILSVLCFLHDIRGLPLSGIRGLNYVHGMVRRFLEAGQSNEKDVDSFLPKYLFQDQPLEGISQRPVSLWWKIMSEEERTSYQGPHGSLSDLAFLCPQYPRLRLMAHWDAREKAFHSYGAPVALMDAHALTEIVTQSVRRVRMRTEEIGTPPLENKVFLVAHSDLLCGGPITLSPKDIVKIGSEPCLSHAIFQKMPIVNMTDQLAMRELRGLFEDGRRLTCEPPSNTFHIVTDDWVWMGDVCLMTYEVNTGHGSRGLGTFVGRDGGSEQDQYMDDRQIGFIRWKSIKEFKIKPHEFLERKISPDQITYHLFRHDPRPVFPRSLLRVFFHNVKYVDLVDNASEMLCFDNL